jgi:hypothetical protein
MGKEKMGIDDWEGGEQKNRREGRKKSIVYNI